MYTYLALNQLLLPACDIHYAIHEAIREIYANAEIWWGGGWFNHDDAEKACGTGHDVCGNVDEDISDTDDAEDTFRISDVNNFLTTYLPTYLIDIELNFGMNSLVYANICWMMHIDSAGG